MTSLPVTLLAFFHGSGEVALYGLMLQVVAALALPFSILQQPMWTRMNQLLNHTHYASVKLMIIKYIKYAFVYSILTSSIIMLLLNPILNTFLNKHIDFPFALRIAFSLYCTLGLVAGGGVGTVLLALDLARPMAMMAFLQLVMFLICALLFAPIYGTVAMVLSVSATYCISIPCSIWLIRKHCSLII
jgi:O-antigen/teichoic acid export membrane protein